MACYEVAKVREILKDFPVQVRLRRGIGRLLNNPGDKVIIQRTDSATWGQDMAERFNSCLGRSFTLAYEYQLVVYLNRLQLREFFRQEDSKQND